MGLQGAWVSGFFYTVNSLSVDSNYCHDIHIVCTCIPYNKSCAFSSFCNFSSFFFPSKFAKKQCQSTGLAIVQWCPWSRKACTVSAWLKWQRWHLGSRWSELWAFWFVASIVPDVHIQAQCMKFVCSWQNQAEFVQSEAGTCGIDVVRLSGLD